jgi:dienelactone hydrolase
MPCRLIPLALVLLVAFPTSTLAAGVMPLFDLSSPSGGPFPSDLFTAPDSTQNTGVHMDLPKPDCSVRPSDCADLDGINTLDGFNLQLRLSIPFSGPIDPASVTSATVFLVDLGDTLGGTGGAVIGLNQVVWDPATNTLYAESDQLLDQHSRWALVVTNGVRDADGDPIEAGGFSTFRHDLNFGQTKDRALKVYRKTLIDTIDALAAMGLDESRIAAMSVFSTLSATALLEKVRDQIKAAVPAPATMLGTFPLASVSSIQFKKQTGTATFSTSNLPLGSVAGLTIVPGVGAIAFGQYAAPDYRTAVGVIPSTATRTGTPVVQNTRDVFFNLIVPSGPPPADGWPVVIWGHGNSGNKQGTLFNVAAKFASHGLASIGINVIGNGGGPLGTLTIVPTVGDPVTIPAGGRARDVNSDGVITEPEDGALKDRVRQTVIDLLQLVRVIQTGGIPALNASRIYYAGQSLGGQYGTLLLAIDPDVRAGVLNVPGGSNSEIGRLSPVFRSGFGLSLVSRVPSLLNAPLGAPFFGINENIPFRDQPPVVNTVFGAPAIQEVVDRTEWLQQVFNPVAYSPHIRKSPLTGAGAKPVIVQFGKGDETNPNPTQSAQVRAGDLTDRVTYFRNDLAFSDDSTTPKDPHGFLTNLPAETSPGHPLARVIALDAQEQIATFLASDGTVTIDPDGVLPYFEVPIVGPLPEALNFIP